MLTLHPCKRVTPLIYSSLRLNTLRYCSINMSSSPPSSSPPPLSHVLETCLYVRDLASSVKFYKDIFQLKPFLDTVSRRSH